MKSMIACWTAGLTIPGGLLFWRNKSRYHDQSTARQAGKSVVELVILFLTATFLPALLVVWLVVWATQPIKTPWLRTTVGVLTGVVFGFLSNVAVEVLVLLGVFSIDMKTGTAEPGGCLNWWRRATISDVRQQQETQRVAATA